MPSVSPGKLLSLFIILFPCFALAQGTLMIRGSVVEETSGKAVPFASVYVDGTTIGMRTDSLGHFELHPVLLPVTIIVSHLSYEPKAVGVEAATADIMIRVSARTSLLTEVVITQQDTWKYDLQRFKNNFLGADYWGKHAILRNDSVLDFTRDKSDFFATASRPLIVDQPKLGYRVSADLTQFSMVYNKEYRSSEVSTLGHYFFEPYKDESNGKYKEARQQAYFNSAQHFLKALYDHDLEEQGYRVFEKFYDAITNKEAYRYPELASFSHYENGDLIFSGLAGKHFSVLYFFNKKMKPVKFKEEKAGAYRQSAIYFLNDTCVVHSNGTISDNSIMFGGEIGDKKVGAMMPENYTAE